MNTLFSVWQPLGDLICGSCFLYDYHLQYPNQNLYIAPLGPWNHPVAERLVIFINQGWINIYQGQKIDKEIKIPQNPTFYNLVRKDNSWWQQKYNVTDLYYIGLKQYFKLDIKRQTYNINLKIPDLFCKKINFNTKKQICLLDITNLENIDSRFYCTQKYQKIVNALKDDLYFIQIGFTPYGYKVKNLQNIDLNLINKTDIKTLLTLLYNSRFVICRQGGIRHISQLKRNNRLDIFTVTGNRNIQLFSVKNNQNIFNHSYQSKEKYDCCLNKETNKCLLKDITQCRNVVQNNGQKICKCFYDIDQNLIINDIKEILKNV